jgi:hypothetical protein
MPNRSTVLLLLIIVCAALAGCEEASPTAPQSPAVLIGAWQGPLAASPTGEDWSNVRLTLQVGASGTPTGTLTSKNGVAHPVTSRLENGLYFLDVGTLPQTAPCTVALIVENVSSSVLSGHLSGRCPNTLLDRFRLEKV